MLTTLGTYHKAAGSNHPSQQRSGCPLQGVKASSAFPLPKPRAVADAVCGAPAQAQAAVEEQKLAQKEEDEGLASASDWEVRHESMNNTSSATGGVACFIYCV